MFKKQKDIFFLVLIALALMGAGAWLGAFFSRMQSGVSSYSAVYLTTGEVYFGKLSWFPAPHLDNVWFVNQAVDEQNRSQPAIVSLATLFWKPSNRIYLNPEQIMLVTRIQSDSEMVKIFEQPAFFAATTTVPGSP